MSYYFVRAGNYHDKAKIARAVASNPKQDDIPTEHRSGGVWARMRTRVLLCGDRPPNCRWRPLQIRPLDRPVCLPLALSFAFVSIYPPVFSPYPCLRILSFSLLYRAFEPRIATLLVGIRSFYYRFVTNKNLHCVYFVLRGRRWYILSYISFAN